MLIDLLTADYTVEDGLITAFLIYKTLMVA